MAAYDGASLRRLELRLMYDVKIGVDLRIPDSQDKSATAYLPMTFPIRYRRLSSTRERASHINQNSFQFSQDTSHIKIQVYRGITK
jgi:hypothetical protein